MTNVNLANLLDRLERELPLSAQGPAIKYINERYDGAFTKARTELTEAIKQGEGLSLADTYFETCTKWFREYKQHWVAQNPGLDPPWLPAQRAYVLESLRHPSAQDSHPPCASPGLVPISGAVADVIADLAAKNQVTS